MTPSPASAIATAQDTIRKLASNPFLVIGEALVTADGPIILTDRSFLGVD